MNLDTSRYCSHGLVSVSGGLNAFDTGWTWGGGAEPICEAIRGIAKIVGGREFRGGLQH